MIVNTNELINTRHCVISNRAFFPHKFKACSFQQSNQLAELHGSLCFSTIKQTWGCLPIGESTWQFSKPSWVTYCRAALRETACAARDGHVASALHATAAPPTPLHVSVRLRATGGRLLLCCDPSGAVNRSCPEGWVPQRQAALRRSGESLTVKPPLSTIRPVKK